MKYNTQYRDMTVSFLRANNIRYDSILFNMPMGERIINGTCFLGRKTTKNPSEQQWIS